MTENQMVWDLSQLVRNIDPAAIRAELEAMVTQADQIRKKYHGKIKDLNSEGLLQLLEGKDNFTLKFEGVVKYCHLKYSADTTDVVATQLNDAVLNTLTKVDQTLAFIDLELGRLLKEKSSMIEDPTLAEYMHYLEKVLRRVPYMLSETEERLTIVKDRNGIKSWEKLQIDWLSTRTFDIEIEGKRQTLPYGKIIGLYQSPNRELRKTANEVVYKNLGKDDIVWASAIRAICEDHVQMCRLRRYETPMTQSLVANDVDQETINSLMKIIEENVELYRRYLRLKAKLMNIDRLANYDLVAPLPKAPIKEYSWSESRTETVNAYRSFDNEVACWVEEMFDRRHIDGEVRKGKESGAFCASWLSGKSAYILQSFNKRMGDIYTQAHELGHAVHAYLGSRSQKPSNYEIGSCVAEIGSTFGELLLTEKLLARANTKGEKQSILAHVLDEFGMAAFQVSARVFFEQSMYDTIEQGKLLDGETVSRLWVAARDKIFGDAVQWLDVMKWEWTMKSHYYIANYRFYNYPYVFAQLFVYALYRIYKEEGREFVPKFKKILAAGSSMSPRELAAKLGFHIRDESFWRKGVQQAEEFIKMLEAAM